jgi:hypothetical protein
MKRALSKLSVGTALTLLMLAGGVQTVSAQQPPVEPRGFGIEGTWDATVTLLNCSTGLPLFPPGPRPGYLDARSRANLRTCL